MSARKDQYSCPWRLSTHRLDPTIRMWRICTYTGPHAPRCVVDALKMDNRNFTANFIKGAILCLICKDQTLKPAVIIEIIHGQYGVYVSYMKAWKAKQKAISQIFGDWE